LINFCCQKTAKNAEFNYRLLSFHKLKQNWTRNLGQSSTWVHLVP